MNNNQYTGNNSSNTDNNSNNYSTTQRSIVMKRRALILFFSSLLVFIISLIYHIYTHNHSPIDTTNIANVVIFIIFTILFPFSILGMLGAHIIKDDRTFDNFVDNLE